LLLPFRRLDGDLSGNVPLHLPIPALLMIDALPILSGVAGMHLEPLLKDEESWLRIYPLNKW
jgi:hypothetical protein